jgi:nucleoside-diphosphate-sugar epimerase
MMLRIAVTGASGFVGRATVTTLLAAGHNVSVLMRNPTAEMDQRLSIVRGELADTTALQALVKNADVVLHIAGVVSALSRAHFMLANADGAAHVARIAFEAGIKRFVHVSSIAAREPALNDYAASKAAGEKAVLDYANKMQITVIRPSAVYGPGDKATLPLFQQLMSKRALIPGMKDAKFSMVHVDDVAQVLAEAVASSSTGLYELDDGARGHRWMDVIDVTSNAFGTPHSAHFIPRGVALALGLCGDVFSYLTGKNAMIRTGQMRQLYHADWVAREQNWPLKKRVSLAEGVPATIRWYQQQGMLPRHEVTDRRAA